MLLVLNAPKDIAELFDINILGMATAVAGLLGSKKGEGGKPSGNISEFTMCSAPVVVDDVDDGNELLALVNGVEVEVEATVALFGVPTTFVWFAFVAGVTNGDCPGSEVECALTATSANGLSTASLNDGTPANGEVAAPAASSSALLDRVKDADDVDVNGEATTPLV